MDCYISPEIALFMKLTRGIKWLRETLNIQVNYGMAAYMERTFIVLKLGDWGWQLSDLHGF